MSNKISRRYFIAASALGAAWRALCLAGEIAQERGAELVVVHAIGLTDVVDGHHVVAEGHAAEIQAEFAEWCLAVRTVGLDDWDPRLVYGNPVDGVLRVGDETDAGLIVVGRQGAGRRPELLLGSTAHQIAERARCPVMIVPPVG